MQYYAISRNSLRLIYYILHCFAIYFALSLFISALYTKNCTCFCTLLIGILFYPAGGEQREDNPAGGEGGNTGEGTDGNGGGETPEEREAREQKEREDQERKEQEEREALNKAQKQRSALLIAKRKRIEDEII